MSKYVILRFKNACPFFLNDQTKISAQECASLNEKRVPIILFTSKDDFQHHPNPIRTIAPHFKGVV